MITILNKQAQDKYLINLKIHIDIIAFKQKLVYNECVC
jgi:hypothetical protein